MMMEKKAIGWYGPELSYLCCLKLQAQEHEHKKGSANEFMHRSPVDRLVQRFEY